STPSPHIGNSSLTNRKRRWYRLITGWRECLWRARGLSFDRCQACGAMRHERPGGDFYTYGSHSDDVELVRPTKCTTTLVIHKLTEDVGEAASRAEKSLQRTNKGGTSAAKRPAEPTAEQTGKRPKTSATGTSGSAAS